MTLELTKPIIYTSARTENLGKFASIETKAKGNIADNAKINITLTELLGDDKTFNDALQ